MQVYVQNPYSLKLFYSVTTAIEVMLLNFDYSLPLHKRYADAEF